MRSVIFWIALILWLILGYFYYDSSCECCNDNSDQKTELSESTKVAPAPIVESIKNATGPLMFRWSDGSTITGDGWEAKRQQILDGLKDHQILEITGLYRADETNNTTFENLGIARANETSKLFIPPLDQDNIRLIGKLTSGEVNKDDPFVSASFKNLINTANIKEIDDKTIIRFPFNSTNKLNDTEVEAYLNDVADRLKNSGERVRLTGFTDNIGSTISNLTLGERRAEIIKQYLLGKGVPADKILTLSKGESNPIATNSTKEGRAENRRTELQIIK